MAETPNLNSHGFALVSSRDLPEIDGRAHVLTHTASKAKLLYLQNDDPNKSFSISFKTVPEDDCGVFHILEHSVLCGSDKFPVKEPFVNLLKSSMQTFLNAMTFPDKTMYPVASTNEQDLLNMMDVYLDAVMHPAIYTKPEIFKQEGWHLEVTDAGEPFYNGVVYNEMKGVMSDPSSMLYYTMCKALFPDTAYRFESGGNPQDIPQLTYERFLEEHARNYRFDNSYIILYGDMDIDLMLGWLDERYLSPIGPGSGALAPRDITLQAPVCTLDAQVTMATSPQNACCALGYVVGTSHDRTRLAATSILVDALAGSNEAPLKRALLDADLACDLTASMDDGILQPFVFFELKGLKPDAAARFKPAFDAALSAILEEGISPELIEGALSHAEFVLREHDFGVADGVALAMSAMSGWLYDDDMSCSYITYQDVFEELRAQIDTGYFDQLARELFLGNPHMAQAEVIPVASQEESCPALAALKETLTDADVEAIRQQTATLREVQEREDTPEELATLPSLGIADLGKAPQRPAMSVTSTQGITCLEHTMPTHGICYALRYYDLAGFAFEDLPYLAVLSRVLGHLATTEHTAAQIDTLTQCKMGVFSFGINFTNTATYPQRPVMSFSVLTSALDGNVDTALALTEEVINRTLFDDVDRIQDILGQIKVHMEQGFINAGHRYALQRVSSYTSRCAVAAEHATGVDFYLFLTDLLERYDERADALRDKLAELARQVFTLSPCTLSLAGAPDVRQTYLSLWADAGIPVAAAGEAPVAMEIPDPVIKNEAFCIPGNVVYAAQGANRFSISPACAPVYDAAWQVASRAVSFDYLWNEVRVKGGAYGTGFQTDRLGTLRFYSYRDPHAAQTFERFEASTDWLRAFDPADRELEGYIVSSVAAIDSPVKPADQIKRQVNHYFQGVPQDQYLADRDSILTLDRQAFGDLADAIDAALACKARCVFGSPEIIAECADGFQLVTLLQE